MKKLVLSVLIVLAVLLGYAYGQQTSRIWWQYEGRDDQHAGISGIPTYFYFIEDRDTGTRCYAVRGVEATAISCIKK